MNILKVFIILHIFNKIFEFGVMLIYIENDNTDAAFHFSVEEFLMRRFQSEPVMMLWQSDKCVMLGTYQIPFAEVNLNNAEQAGIQIIRRSSGGGAIFADMGTFLYTMIQPHKNGYQVQKIARETIGGCVVNALKKMGVPAVLHGRNDILANGSKISGIAQQIRYGSLCTHGSILYDTDLELLARVLLVDGDKIKSKGIRSVRSRVKNIKEYINLPARDFKRLLKEYLLDGISWKEYILSEKELAEVQQIYLEKYGNTCWNFSKSPPFSFSRSKRFIGGKMEVFFDIAKDIVTSCTIRGDFLGTVPIRILEEKLENTSFQYQAFKKVLNEIEFHSYLGDITKDEFLSCIFDQTAVD